MLPDLLSVLTEWSHSQVLRRPCCWSVPLSQARGSWLRAMDQGLVCVRGQGSRVEEKKLSNADLLCASHLPSLRVPFLICILREMDPMFFQGPSGSGKFCSVHHAPWLELPMVSRE